MPLWSNVDEANGRPKYANNANVYGVDATEAGLHGKTVSPGWVQVTYGTGQVTGLTVSAGGSAYTNSDVVTVDGNGLSGVVNATANVRTTNSANIAGNVAVTSGEANVVGTGTDFTARFANGDGIFVYSNSTAFTTKKINRVVNGTFLNITTTWAFTNAETKAGEWGIINEVIVNPDTAGGSGSGFRNLTTTNVSITTTDGQLATLVPVLGGRAGRKSWENMVFINGMTGDAEDTEFPDS